MCVCMHTYVMGVIYYIFIYSTHFILLFVDNEDVICLDAEYRQIEDGSMYYKCRYILLCVLTKCVCAAMKKITLGVL
jgi:hypothetical protein